MNKSTWKYQYGRRMLPTYSTNQLLIVWINKFNHAFSLLWLIGIKWNFVAKNWLNPMRDYYLPLGNKNIPGNQY